MDESIIDSVFMELASQTRRSMMETLSDGDEKLSKIAESLGMTIQEAHRNSVRLTKSGLIKKTSDSTFSLTPLGRILIKQTTSISFLLQYKDYFEQHTSGEIPDQFIRRLGDLQNCKQVTGMGAVLQNWKRIGSDAESFIKIITTEYPMDLAVAYVEKAKKGATFDYIFGYNTRVPKEREELLKKASWKKIISEGTVRRKMIKNIQTCVTINEKEACVFFPDLQKNTDMLTGFFSTDPSFRQWCIDYFAYQWNNADMFEESKQKGFTLLYFEKQQKNELRFLHKAEYVSHEYAKEKNAQGKERTVIKFKLRILE